jgi:hypothetical protein
MTAASPTVSTTPYMMDIATLNAQLKEDYAAWRDGIFRVYVLHPQQKKVLLTATSEQLVRRRIYVSRFKGRAYRTEYMNIRRILEERDEEKEAKRQLKAAHAHAARPILPDHDRINAHADADIAVIETFEKLADAAMVNDTEQVAA